MGKIYRQFLHAFSVDSGVKLKKFFLQKYIVLCVNDFNGSKRIKDSFNVFILCVLKSDASIF